MQGTQACLQRIARCFECTVNASGSAPQYENHSWDPAHNAQFKKHREQKPNNSTVTAGKETWHLSVFFLIQCSDQSCVTFTITHLCYLHHHTPVLPSPSHSCVTFTITHLCYLHHHTAVLPSPSHTCVTFTITDLCYLHRHTAVLPSQIQTCVTFTVTQLCYLHKYRPVLPSPSHICVTFTNTDLCYLHHHGPHSHLLTLSPSVVPQLASLAWLVGCWCFGSFSCWWWWQCVSSFVCC